MSIAFWVTEDCNLCCDYCYEGKNKKIAYMSKETIDKSIEFLKDEFFDGMNLLIHGGEPFLAFDIMDYLVKTINAKFSNVNYMVTTNGTIMNERIFKFIVEDLKAITVSIDGDEVTHNMNRKYKNGKGSFSTVIKNAKLLNKYIDELRIRLTINHSTVHNMSSSIEYLIKEGFNFLSVSVDEYDQYWCDDSSHIYKDELIKISNNYRDREDVYIDILDLVYIKKEECRLGKHILPNGNIYPCAASVGRDEFLIGNIFSSLDIPRMEYLKKISKIPLHSECRECSIKESCEYVRCKIINKCITGKFNCPSLIGCTINNINHQVLYM